jgi:3',5'-cyclic AMP phosphodiesterase CpdA
LNFLEPDGLARFGDAIVKSGADALLVTGDISEAPGLEEHLAWLEATFAGPVYFVLGNHDFYRGSIADVRALARAASESGGRLRWMPVAGVVPLSAQAALVGHDGWADARLGDWEGSRVVLNDYLHIDELACLPKPDLRGRLEALGDEAAAYLRATLPGALDRYRHVVVATHVPPFEGACWHEGATSAPDWLPHFSCKATGDAILEALRGREDRNVTILCGHTHGQGTFSPQANVVVYTGGAEYGEPIVQRVLEIH